MVEETSPADESQTMSLESAVPPGAATCFLCMYDYEACPGGKQLSHMLREGIGTISMKALCIQASEFYENEIRRVGAAMGTEYPPLSSDDIREHLSTHDLNPVSQTILQLSKVATILGLLEERMCVKTKGGGTKVNESVARMWVKVGAHRLALQRALPDHCEFMRRSGAGNGTLTLLT